MSVIDRLLAIDGAERQATEPELPMPLGEQRGDFMLLPPLKSMSFGVDRVQYDPRDYLVTRRQAGVTGKDLVHGVDPSRFGRVAGRVRRVRGRRRASGGDLVHRALTEDEWDSEVEEMEEPLRYALPPVPPPRQLRSQAVPAKSAPVAPAASTLPSIADVRKAVSLEAIASPQGTASPPPLAEVARLSKQGSDAAPVVRRRGVAAEPEPTEAEEAKVLPQDLSEADIPQAPDAAVLPSLKGQTRVRGSQPPALEQKAKSSRGKSRQSPPSPTEPNEPVADAPSLAPGVDLTVQPTPPAPTPSGMRATPPQGSAPAAASTPAEASGPAPAARGTMSSPAVMSQTNGTHSGLPAKTQVRATLANREPLVPTGRTGIQRRERDASSPPSARPASAARPAQAARGLASGVSVPTSGGPRQVAVPAAIQQVLRGTVGNAPATVRVHEGVQAAHQSDVMNAEAFTRDGEIFLSSDVPLQSRRGQELLAHELTHVVQQQGGALRMPDESTPAGQAHEAMARQVEAQVAGSGVDLIHRVSPTISTPAPPANVPNGVQRSVAPLVKNSPGMTQGAPVSRPKSTSSDDDEDDKQPEQLSGWGRMKSAGLSWLENQLSEPPPPIPKATGGRRRRELERQARELYPMIRSQLRSELIRDLERRGRLTREWR